jgi:hypothetical protein
MATAGELIGRLFFARNVAHKAHFLTTNYARHKALNDYYDSVIDLTDSFGEKYMGKYGRPDDITLTWAEDAEDIQEFLLSTVEWVEANRYAIVPQRDTYLQNIIDEIVGLHYETLYLLSLT